jgi:hypothetical protein
MRISTNLFCSDALICALQLTHNVRYSAYVTSTKHHKLLLTAIANLPQFATVSITFIPLICFKIHSVNFQYIREWKRTLYLTLNEHFSEMTQIRLILINHLPRTRQQRLHTQDRHRLFIPQKTCDNPQVYLRSREWNNFPSLHHRKIVSSSRATKRNEDHI